MIYQGDCLDVLKSLDENSIDSLVTDPPAGISFMGKDWDHHKGGRNEWIQWMTSVMTEAMRVMKPGAHGLVWALPRTSHWTATALEDAGFEVRDVVTHLFGTGFPKSLNLGNGFGTALKPASEHWILVRKPCSEKTVAANVLKWGCGGINVDGCRIETGARPLREADRRADNVNTYGSDFCGSKAVGVTMNGRFPANLVLDEEAAAMLDEQSLAGGMHSAGSARNKIVESNYEASSFDTSGSKQMNRIGDTGGASRFFYVAKASKSDRGADNIHPCVKSSKLMDYLIKLVTPPGGIVLDPFMGSGSTGVAAKAGGFQFVGIEQSQEYFEIAQKRVNV